MISYFKTLDEKESNQKVKLVMVSGCVDDIIIVNTAIDQARVSYSLDAVKSVNEAVEYFMKCTSSETEELPDFLIIDFELPFSDCTNLLNLMSESEELNGVELILLREQENESLNKNDERFRDMIQIPKSLICDYLGKCVRDFSLELESFQQLPSGEIDCSVTQNRKNSIYKFQPGNVERNEGRTPVLLGSQDKCSVNTSLESQRKVLLIEDNLTDARFIQKRLKETFLNEFDIVHKISLEGGIKYLSEREVDVVILDLTLPDASGLSGLRVIREEFPDIPVVVLTGARDSSLALEALKMGAQDYLVKHVRRYGEILGRIIRYGIERKKVELLVQHSLKVEQSVLKEVLDEAPFIVIRVDNSLEIRSVNPAFEKICGMNEEELSGRSLHEIFPLLTRDLLYGVVTNGDTVSLQQKQVKNIGNNNFDDLYLDVVAWPTQKTSSVAKEAVVICTDVSERVKFNKQREEFVAAIAHDIRNPLVGELRVLKAILNDALGKLSKPVVSALEAIIKSNNSLLLMLSNMVDVYQLEASGAEIILDSLDLGELTSKVLSEMDYLTYGAHVNLEYYQIDDDCLIQGDKTALSRVLQNLIFNAVKYAQLDSTISISIYKSDDHSVVLSVKNKGPGIDEKEFLHLFDRFTQLVNDRKASHSSGFGLYLCKKIVEGHGGIISCVSNSEETTFTVTIPSLENSLSIGLAERKERSSIK